MQWRGGRQGVLICQSKHTWGSYSNIIDKSYKLIVYAVSTAAVRSTVFPPPPIAILVTTGIKPNVSVTSAIV